MANKEVSQSDTKKSSADQSPAALEFLNGTKEELDKVVWPSRQQLASESVAVILMVTLSAALIYLVDSLYGWLSGLIF
jgi:preprotein translocase subunit SecE